jgi:hypothetical protein
MMEKKRAIRRTLIESGGLAALDFVLNGPGSMFKLGADDAVS